jgi:glycosidase
MTDKATSDLWWKSGVIYCADVATWLDSDGDGTGDLAGLTRQLDYLRGLGVSTLWMMPFYPSPLGDDGYDITDYYAVDSRFGTLGDFVEMIRTADNLGIRVLVDLVMSHTSNQHPGSSGPATTAVPGTGTTTAGAIRSRKNPARWRSPVSRRARGPMTTRPDSGTCTATTTSCPT